MCSEGPHLTRSVHTKAPGWSGRWGKCGEGSRHIIEGVQSLPVLSSNALQESPCARGASRGANLAWRGLEGPGPGGRQREGRRPVREWEEDGGASYSSTSSDSSPRGDKASPSGASGHRGEETRLDCHVQRTGAGHRP